MDGGQWVNEWDPSLSNLAMHVIEKWKRKQTNNYDCAVIRDTCCKKELPEHVSGETEKKNAGKCKLLIAIAGIPGSGKTTLAESLANTLNQMKVKYTDASEKSVQPSTAETSQSMGGFDSCISATFLPMDGFHLWRWQLDLMEDPEEAYKRRGAPWTFDGVGYVDMIKKLRECGTCVAPGWDHAAKDPTPGGKGVTESDDVVILEGNYLMLKETPWMELKELVDEMWMIECNIDDAMERVAKRAVVAEIEPTEEKAWERVEYNDRPNGIYIIENSYEGNIRIKWK